LIGSGSAVANLHKTQRKSSAATPHAPPQLTTAPSKTETKHHLAISVPSPARHRAAARQRTGMQLQNHTSHPQAPLSRNNAPKPHNQQSQKR
jgi:hypothetical protein